MKGFFQFFIDRSMLANLLTIGVLLLGAVTLTKINRSDFPKVDLGEMLIQTSYPGASAEDVELNVTREIEEELSSVTGIKEMTSISMENFSHIQVKIDPDVTDEQQVKDDVRDAVARVTDFPEEVTESPKIVDIKTSIFPVIQVGVAGDIPYRELREHTRILEKKLKEIPGVASIDQLGYYDREVHIEVSPAKMRQFQIPLKDIVQAIQARNIRTTGGSLESYTSEKNVVAIAQFREPLEVNEVIIRSGFNGPQIKVKDLAIVKDIFEEPDSITHMNGKPVIALLINKSENADVIDTVDAIRRVAEKEKSLLNGAVELMYTSDEAKNVRNKFKIVRFNGLFGLFIITFLLTLFLDLRTSFWVALGIPVTLAGTIWLLPFFNIELDSLTLMAMVIVIGIIVDDAIIISENIFNHIEEGETPKAAALLGIHQVYKPVLTTIFTTFLAFLPMLYMSGTMGKFVRVIPITITLALFISLLETFIALPSHLLPGLTRWKEKNKKKNGNHWFFKIKSSFRNAMDHVLRWRYAFVLGAVLALFGSIMYAKQNMDFILFDTKGADDFQINVELPIGTSLEAMSDKLKEIEDILNKLPEDELSAYSTGASQVDAVSEGNQISMVINLTPYGNRTRDANEIIEHLRAQTSKLEGFKKVNFSVAVGPPVGKPVTLRVVSSDDELRTKCSDEVYSVLSKIEGVKDIERDDKVGKEQVEIKINYTKLARLGLTVSDVAQNIRIAYDGQIVTRVRYGEEDVGFRVILQKDVRKKLDYLSRLEIPNKEGRLISLNRFAELEVGPGPSTFRHYDGDRTITVTSDVDQDVITPIQATEIVLSQINLDQDYPGIRIVVGGGAEENQKSMQDLLVAFLLAIIGIYFLLVLLFNSLTQPLLVLVAIPFGIIGVIITFAVHNEPLTFLAIIGVIGLVGVVVNDSLVLVNHINFLKIKYPKKDFFDIIAEGTSNRLRPILMTTITTVSGLLPLAYGLGGWDYMMSPMALALGYGLLFATPLTLILIPCLYGITGDVKHICSQDFIDNVIRKGFWGKVIKKDIVKKRSGSQTKKRK